MYAFAWSRYFKTDKLELVARQIAVKAVAQQIVNVIIQYSYCTDRLNFPWGFLSYTQLRPRSTRMRLAWSFKTLSPWIVNRVHIPSNLNRSYYYMQKKYLNEPLSSTTRPMLAFSTRSITDPRSYNSASEFCIPLDSTSEKSWQVCKFRI